MQLARNRVGLFVGALFLFVISAFALFEEESLALTRQFLASSPGVTGIVALVTVGLALDVFLPVPATILAAAAAATLGDGPAFLAVWLGLSAGCVLGYEFGASAGHAALRRLVSDASERRMRWLEGRFGLGALAFCRPIPVLAEVSVLLAGSARVRRSLFYTMTISANVVVALLYVVLVPSLS